MDVPADNGATEPRDAGDAPTVRRVVNTARAGLVSMAGTVAQVGIQVVSLAVLSRLLDPADFGLYAMAMTFVGFSVLFKDMGLSAAAVQAKNLSVQARSNLFWINTGTGLALTAALAATAPLVQGFFRQEGVGLVVLLMCPTLLLAGLSVQFNATLQRQMRFVELTVINVTGGLIGLAASVIIALTWGGVWALALPQLIAGVFTAGTVALRAGWLPRRPRRDASMREILGFGGGLFAAQLVTYLYRNLDVALMGRWHGAVWTGHLNRAVQVTRMPLSMLTAPFAQIALARMSRHQEDDAQLSRLMLLGQKLQSYPLLLAGGALIAVADQLILIVLGPGWENVGLLVRLVVAVEVFSILPSAAGWLLSARGMGRWIVRLAVITAAVRVTCILLGSIFGPYGIVAGNAVGALVMWPFNFWLCGRITPIPASRLMAQSAFAVSVTALATTASWAAGHWALPLFGTLGSAAVAGLVMTISMAALIALLPALRRDLVEVWTTVQSARR